MLGHLYLYWLSSPNNSRRKKVPGNDYRENIPGKKHQISTNTWIFAECSAKGGGGSIVEHHPSSYWEQPFSQPYFDNTTKRETITTVGQTAYLHCRVRNLGDRAVSIKKTVIKGC